jgi:hypothetical protein
MDHTVGLTGPMILSLSRWCPAVLDAWKSRIPPLTRARSGEMPQFCHRDSACISLARRCFRYAGVVDITTCGADGCINWNRESAVNTVDRRCVSMGRQPHSVSHHRLHLLRVSVPLRLQRVQNPTHLLPLPSRQLNLPRSKVLLQTMRLSRARNRNHALRHHPSQSDLRQSAAFTLGEGLDLLYDLLVVVEILALELGDCEGL